MQVSFDVPGFFLPAGLQQITLGGHGQMGSWSPLMYLGLFRPTFIDLFQRYTVEDFKGSSTRSFVSCVGPS